MKDMGGQPRLAQNKPETVGKTGQKASKAAGSRITYTTILPIIIFRRNQRQETIKSLGVATQPILYSQKKIPIVNFQFWDRNTIPQES